MYNANWDNFCKLIVAVPGLADVFYDAEDGYQRGTSQPDGKEEAWVSARRKSVMTRGSNAGGRAE